MPTVGFRVLLVISCFCGAVFACGDKLMLLTGGPQFAQVNGGGRPASILAYTRQNSQVSGLVKEFEHHPALQQAGHKFVAVQDVTGLGEALQKGKYDLVLVDSADADGLADEIRSAPSRPVLLPVLYRPTKAEATAVEKKFRCVLKTPASPRGYLAAIGTAMERHLKGAPGRAPRQ